MQRTNIIYNDIKLRMPTFLAYVWPRYLPTIDFPTYCGAGDGLGDLLVPDSIYGMRVAPACLIHDIDWLVSSGTYAGFSRDNRRFLKNLLSIWRSNSSIFPVLRYIGCWRYYFAVQFFGYRNYAPVNYDKNNPLSTPAIKEKLLKLNERSKNV